MASAPITIKLRCASWKQLATIYKRDLARSALFLKSSKPPPIGTKMRINLTLPSDTLIILSGSVTQHVPKGGMSGRGPGIDIGLDTIPQSAMWLIESALSTVNTEDSTVTPIDAASASAAKRRSVAPPTQQARQVTPPPIPSMDDGADLVDAEDSLVAALKKELESLSKLNPFQVLGIGYETNDEAVRAAFGELTKRYHPDRYARYQSGDARHYASEIFILIRDAYRKLGSADARARTLDVLKNRRAIAKAERRATPTAAKTPPPIPKSAPPKTPPPVKTPAPAKTPTPQPRATSQSRPSRSAQMPAQSSPPQLGHSGADKLIEEGKYDEALALYRLATRRNPNDAKSRAGIELAEGLKAMAQRDRLEAAQRFEAVLELDPTNERAARELAEMRRQATNDRKGLLARLLGKKE